MAQARKPRPALSRPLFKRDIQLKSLQAQKVVRRSFDKLKHSLFSISVILRIISDDDEEIQRIDAYITEQFNAVERELTGATAQLQTMLATNGVNDLATYSKPEVITVELDSPRASAFLALVSQLDELILLIDTAWLCGAFDDIQKKDATFQWQQRLIRLAGRIVAIERRARKAAITQGKADEVQAKAPVDTADPDAEIAHAADAQGNEIKLASLDESI